MCEEILRKDEVDNAKTATSIHYSVGKEVRSAIEKIGGTMPEDLPTPEKSIQEIENAKTIFSIDNYDRESMEKGKIMFERDVELEYAVRYLLNR